MGRLVDADAIIQFPYSPESGTSDMIEDWIEEVGLCGESVDFNEGITEKARELCKLVIEGFINIIITEPTAYDVEKVVTEIQKEYCKKCRNILSVPNANKYCKSVNCDIGIMCDIVKRGGVE